MGMIHEIQEIRSHKGFTAADVELKNPAGREGVDDPDALICGQLSPTFDAGIRQAVNAR
jgi:hypothetical protein